MLKVELRNKGRGGGVERVKEELNLREELRCPIFLAFTHTLVQIF